MTFQAGMCMKTKETVRNPRPEVRSRTIPTAGVLILTLGSRLLASFFENEGSSGYIDESKRTGKLDTGYGKWDAERAHSDSWLLTSGSVLQKMKVHPEMLLKTKDRESGIRGTGNGTRRTPILTPDSSLLAPFFKKSRCIRRCC